MRNTLGMPDATSALRCTCQCVLTPFKDVGMPHSYSQKNIGQGAASSMDADQGMRLVAPLHLRTSTATCWQCQGLTQVHAIVASDVVDLGESGQCRTYVHGIANPSNELTQTLHFLAPNLRVDEPDADGELRLTNHCAHCGALQADVYLFEEPGAPFFGRPPEGHLGAEILGHDVMVGDAHYST